MAWDMGMRRVIVETDSKIAFQCIEEVQTCSRNTVIREIREMKKRPWKLEFKLIYCEANRCADWLARSSVDTEEFCFMDLPHEELIPLLTEDLSENFVTRSIELCYS
ncbi:uncharacterized protein [Arachis hypogaea]|uniref:uncharacterized protein n=1 Tax=Arachis hypogaea TaxID=3818 RepID=UPI000DEC86DA|nr:uncharacterized protein LOC112717819 [Arachis hypogaea]